MPPDIMTIVSTGIGVSLIAGVLSGVCYVLAYNVTKRRRHGSNLEWHCVVCGRYIRSENFKVVICLNCEERVCKQRCSKRDFSRKGWICYTCLKRPSWLHSTIKSIVSLYKNTDNTKLMITHKKEKMGEVEKNNKKNNKEEKGCVRDFIEKIVSAIVGGSVDNVSVSKLYRDKQYEALFDKYHEDLSNAITDLSSSLHISLKNSRFSEVSPSLAHTNLKLLIERILHEAAHLPHFRKEVEPTTASNENKQTYEELLATAILNKIINKHEDEVDSSFEYTKSGSGENISKKHERWKSVWKHTDFESSSTSSLDEYLQSDSSHSSTKYVDYSSLTIQQRIDEIPSSQEEVDGEYLRTSPSNWYLQKRPFIGSVSPVPVPMVVPNPVTNAKVFIGDKEIDDTSDLSDAANDYDIENFVTANQDFTIDSNILITGKTYNQTSNNKLSDEETSFDSGVRDDRDDRDDFSDKEKFNTFTLKTDINIDEENIENTSLSLSPDSNIEKDSEYLEKYGTLPKTVVKRTSPSPTSSPSSFTEQSRSSINYDNFENGAQSSQTNENYTEEEKPMVFEGSYSKKEKEKWNNPVNLPYNPYSEENIRRRIRTNQRYGRDYYTKHASMPSGQTKSSEDDFWKNDNHPLYEENGGLDVYRAVPISTMDEYDDHIVYPSERLENRDIFNNVTNSNSDPDDYYNNKNHQNVDDDDEVKMIIQINTKEPTYYDDTVQKEVMSDNEKQPIERDVLPPYNSDDNFRRPPPIKKYPMYHEDTTTRREMVISVDEKVPVTPEVVPSSNSNDNFTLPPPVKKYPMGHDDIIRKKGMSDEKLLVGPELLLSNTSRNDKPTVPLRTPTEKYLVKNMRTDPLVKENYPNNSTASARKLDNTLIKKIYSNPVVRSFALTNREQIPYETNNNNQKTNTSEKYVELPVRNNKKHYPQPIPVTPPASPTKLEEHEDDNEILITGNFSLELSENNSITQENPKLDDDVKELKDRRLVASRLGELSKSFPNLTRSTSITKHRTEEKYVRRNVPKYNNAPPVVEGEETSDSESIPSVKELKKLFEKNEAPRYNKDKPVHSLTARSISQEMKTRLKNFVDHEHDNSF